MPASSVTTLSFMGSATKFLCFCEVDDILKLSSGNSDRNDPKPFTLRSVDFSPQPATAALQLHRSRPACDARNDCSAPSGQEDNAEIPQLDGAEQSQVQGPRDVAHCDLLKALAKTSALKLCFPLPY